MAKFVLAYRGGSMGDTPEQQQAQMEAWMHWMGSLGDSLLDPGDPFGGSSTIASDGTVSKDGVSKLTGYSIVLADTQAEAEAKAKGCPVLQSGGTVEVYEATPVGG